MGEVKSMWGGDVIIDDRGKNDDCIGLLERMLEKAKQGEICGAAMAVQYTDGSSAAPCAGYLMHARISGELMRHVTRMLTDAS